MAVMEGPFTEDLGHSSGVWSSDLPEGRWTAGLQGEGAALWPLLSFK